MSEELNEKTSKAAKKLDISKNDYILLAIQEKLRREINEEKDDPSPDQF